jgi:hypothetical protein
MQYGAGGALNEETGLWQLWVTTDGYHINWVAAYREQAHIDAAMQELKQVGATGDLFNVEKLRATLDRLYEGREADPVAMPEAVQAIRRNLRGTGTWKS